MMLHEKNKIREDEANEMMKKKEEMLQSKEKRMNEVVTSYIYIFFIFNLLQKEKDIIKREAKLQREEKGIEVRKRRLDEVLL